MPINRDFVHNIHSLTESMQQLQEQADLRKDFRQRLKEYYQENKALGQFKKGGKFTARDLAIVARSLNFESSELSSILRYFWGFKMNLSDLNEKLTEEGFFE